MTFSNKLILLREEHKFSQQQVADDLGVSKSTYCRFEKGLSVPNMEEINAILHLYDISYEEFMDIALPIESIVSYPDKLLRNLKDAIEKYGVPSDNYYMNYENYYKIKEAMEPIIRIREKALNFPNINISDIPRNTIVKTIKFDLRGEKLIDAGFKSQNMLFEAMQDHFKTDKC